jgi:UDP-2,3-diacylglucosamine pyrophosphatase LpxH
METYTHKPACGYVTSDLHVFGCSSLYEKLLPIFYEQVTRHPVIVLNGDTFDFKRSRFTSSLETTKHAIAWLQDLSRLASSSSIFYILGNHDCHETFVQALHTALPTLPNVTIVPEHLRLGSCLFIHGDAIDLAQNVADITYVRSKYNKAEPRWGAKAFANLVTHMGLNKVEYLRHSRAVLARRILSYLRITQPSALEGVRQIYFGHTHVPIDHFEYAGIIFYNTGSMIRGLPWRPMEFSGEY